MDQQKAVKTLVVLGSGGHTGEMMKLLSGTDLNKYRPIEFIVADSDSMSVQKVKQFEEQLKAVKEFDYKIHKIPRSRKVGQSYITSIWTTIVAFLYTIPLIFKIKPELLLVNGPGTCVPCCFLVYILSHLYLIPKCKIVFIESICRVKTLSLTGKILYLTRITDSFMVQWKDLQNKYKKAIYMGRLV